MITERERFLMRAAIEASKWYDTLDEWLEVAVDDAGHTVEQHLSHDADEIAKQLKERKG